jgi:hypothetical protein
MKAVILQSNYLPWKGYFDLIHEADVFVFYDCVKYTKNDWRNRNRIYSKNGLQWLTIPIEASATRLLIEEVEIKNSQWQDIHFKTLYLAYKRAPYFLQLEELMQDYLKEKSWKLLSDLNQYLIIKISRMLGITTAFRQAREFNIEGNRVQRLINILKEVRATEYISGLAAKNYIEGQEHLFEQENIQLTFKYYPIYPTYPQLCKPFEQAVSIVDMIANIPVQEIKNYIWDYEK